jgi:hypothetical protein
MGPSEALGAMGSGGVWSGLTFDTVRPDELDRRLRERLDALGPAEPHVPDMICRCSQWSDQEDEMYLPTGYTPGAMWTKMRDDGKIEWACHCGCHEGSARPRAEEAMLCKPCADEAFTPWTATLESFPDE